MNIDRSFADITPARTADGSSSEPSDERAREKDGSADLSREIARQIVAANAVRIHDERIFPERDCCAERPKDPSHYDHVAYSRTVFYDGFSAS